MLEKTFKKLGNALETMREEIDAAVKGATGDLIKDELVAKQGKFTVTIKNGDVSIDGPIKDLRINGKLVRFKNA